MSERTSASQNKLAGNMASPSRNIVSKYTVPGDFDKTPQTLQSLDNYLINDDVYSLVLTLFDNNGNWGKWAKENEIDAESYFSPPYCREALMLGYEQIK